MICGAVLTTPIIDISPLWSKMFIFFKATCTHLFYPRYQLLSHTKSFMKVSNSLIPQLCMCSIFTWWQSPSVVAFYPLSISANWKMSALQSQRLSSLATCTAAMPTQSVNRETGNTQENSYITFPPQHVQTQTRTCMHTLWQFADTQPNIPFTAVVYLYWISFI